MAQGMSTRGHYEMELTISRLRGILHRARADGSIELRNPTADPGTNMGPDFISRYDDCGNAFAINPLENIWDLDIKSLPPPGTTMIANSQPPRSSHRASSESINRETESRSSTTNSSHVRATSDNWLETLRRKHQTLSSQGNADDTDDPDENSGLRAGPNAVEAPSSSPHVSGKTGKTPTPLFLRRIEKHVPLANRLPLELPSRSSLLTRKPPIQFENATQESIAMKYPLPGDSSSENVESPTSGFEDSISVNLEDLIDELPRESVSNKPSSDNVNSPEECDPTTPKNLSMSMDAFMRASTSQGIPEFLDSLADMDNQDGMMFSDASILGEVDSRHTRGDNPSPPPQLRSSVHREENDSDPEGLYNASPPSKATTIARADNRGW